MAKKSRGYVKSEVRAEMVRLEQSERQILAERRLLTTEEQELLWRLQFLRDLWRCRFSGQ